MTSLPLWPLSWRKLFAMQPSIAARIKRIEERIEEACLRSGRKRSEISLMAVTKFQSTEAIIAAWNEGIRLYGESRVQEGLTKYQDFWETHSREGEASLHLIGSLQRNKAKAAAAFFDCIESVDRDSIVDTLGALTEGREKPLEVLLEYHTAEDSKAGFMDRDSLFRAAEKIMSFPGLKPMGLMTMAPFTQDEGEIRSSFRELYEVREELIRRFPLNKIPGGKDTPAGWSCLSMGMTGDFEIAIEEGSTLIRIGTAIFGERSL